MRTCLAHQACNTKHSNSKTVMSVCQALNMSVIYAYYDSASSPVRSAAYGVSFSGDASKTRMWTPRKGSRLGPTEAPNRWMSRSRASRPVPVRRLSCRTVCVDPTNDRCAAGLTKPVGINRRRFKSDHGDRPTRRSCRLIERAHSGVRPEHAAGARGHQHVDCRTT